MYRSLSLFIVCLLMASAALAQELNSLAIQMSDKFPSEYKALIRDAAIDEYGFDLASVSDEINSQVEFLHLVSKLSKRGEQYALHHALVKGSRPGYAMQTILKVRKVDALTLKDLIALNCDWKEVYDQLAQS